MYRTIVYLALVVATFCLLGLIVPQSISALTFLLPNGVDAIVNLVLAAVLMHFGIAGYLRKKSYKLGMSLFGAIWVLLAVLGMAYPAFFGVLPHDMRAANLSMMLMTGIGFMIGGLEYNRPSLVEELRLLYMTGIQDKLKSIEGLALAGE